MFCILQQTWLHLHTCLVMSYSFKRSCLLWIRHVSHQGALWQEEPVVMSAPEQWVCFWTFLKGLFVALYNPAQTSNYFSVRLQRAASLDAAWCCFWCCIPAQLTQWLPDMFWLTSVKLAGPTHKAVVAIFPPSLACSTLDPLRGVAYGPKGAITTWRAGARSDIHRKKNHSEEEEVDRQTVRWWRHNNKPCASFWQMLFKAKKNWFGFIRWLPKGFS